MWPTCSGLVIVPKLALMPLANEAAIASACAVCAGVRPHQVAARGRRAEHAQGRGRVPALFVMVEMHAAGDPRLGLEPGDIGGDEGGAGAVAAVGEREQRRQDRRRRVAAQRIADIVEIERMRRGAVDQRGVERRRRAGRCRRSGNRRPPPAASVCSTMRAQSSPMPASVTPTVSRIAALAQSTASARQIVIADRDDLLGDLFDEGHGEILRPRGEAALRRRPRSSLAQHERSRKASCGNRRRRGAR